VSDFAVHGCVVRETYEESLAELEQLVAAGIGTLKIFSAYTDVIGLSLDQIRRLLARAAQLGVTVFVHAETDAMVREGIAGAVTHGELGPAGHAVSRTPEAEVDAIRTIAEIASRSGANVYFVHVSSAPSVEALRALRAGRGSLLAETCPHYLFLDSEVYARPDGQKWICSPPIRSTEHREALWSALRDGVIDTVSSDHNCYDLAQKGPAGTDFRNVPNGLPGIEHRLPLLIGAAVEGRLSWPRVVQLSAAMPARILGLWPAKGALAVGSDADVVLVDPAGSTDLNASHMATDYSPYTGMCAGGAVREVWRRGMRVVRDGEVDAAPGSGVWLPVRSAAAVRA
jgi:dihydropyrimidinase